MCLISRLCIIVSLFADTSEHQGRSVDFLSKVVTCMSVIVKMHFYLHQFYFIVIENEEYIFSMPQKCCLLHIVIFKFIFRPR